MEVIPLLIAYDKDFKTLIKTCGWGCGYVLIPESHPFYSLKDEYINVGSDLETTYDQFDEYDGTKYRMVGFDTSHMWNSSKQDLSWVLSEVLGMVKYCKENA